MANPLASMVLVFADKGCGKTTDIIRSAPLGFFICKPGALRPSASFLGYDIEQRYPEHVAYVSDMTSLSDVLGQIAAEGLPTTCVPTISVMEFSDLAAETRRYEDENNRAAYTTNSGAFDGRAFWGEQRNILLKVKSQLTTLYDIGYNIMLEAHFASPAWDTPQKNADAARKKQGDIFYPGGPALAAKTHRAEFCRPFTHALHVVTDRRATSGWDKVYASNQGSENVLGTDRDNLWTPQGPHNFAEGMRHRGIPGWERPEELAWMEEVVEAGAISLLAGRRAPDVRDELNDIMLGVGVPVEHARWARWDATCRAAFRTLDKKRALEG